MLQDIGLGTDFLAVTQIFFLYLQTVMLRITSICFQGNFETNYTQFYVVDKAKNHI